MRMLGWRSGKVLACFEPSAGAEECFSSSINWSILLDAIGGPINSARRQASCLPILGNRRFRISFLPSGPRPFSEALKSCVLPIDMPRPGSHDPERLVTAALQAFRNVSK